MHPPSFSTALGRRRRDGFSRLLLSAACLLWALPHLASAQGAESEPRTRAEIIAPHEKALRSQYQIDRLRVPEEAGQIKGYLSVAGDLTPPALARQVQKAGPDGRRSTAQQFLSENQQLLGLEDPATELREYSLRTDPKSERTHITYHRYVGDLRIKAMTIQMHLEADGTLSAVNGNIIPVPAASIAAAERVNETLAEPALRALIEANLQAEGIAPEKIERIDSGLFAKASPPYVVWDAEVLLSGGAGKWIYEIDAFNGDVLHRRREVQSFHTRPHTAPLPGSQTPQPEAGAPSPGNGETAR